jgi:hypothetical protein
MRTLRELHRENHPQTGPFRSCRTGTFPEAGGGCNVTRITRGQPVYHFGVVVL